MIFKFYVVKHLSNSISFPAHSVLDLLFNKTAPLPILQYDPGR